MTLFLAIRLTEIKSVCEQILPKHFTTTYTSSKYTVSSSKVAISSVSKKTPWTYLWEHSLDLLVQ